VKIYVGVILIIDTASSWFAVQWMYELFVLHWGDIEPFTYGGWLLALDPILAGILAFLVQIFFAWRIRIITRNPWQYVPVVIFATLNLLGAIGTAIALIWVNTYARFGEFRPIATIWLVSSAIADLTITAVLSVHLRSRRTGVEKTTMLLHRIIRLTIQNGLLTSLTALTDIILYLSLEKPYHITLSFIIPKLYCNTVLSSLNAREVGKEKEWTSAYSVEFVDLANMGDSHARKNHIVPPPDSPMNYARMNAAESGQMSVYVNVEKHIAESRKSNSSDEFQKPTHSADRIGHDEV
jgi:hypothetical protein